MHDTAYWPRAWYMRALVVVSMLAPFAFVSWIEWHRAFMPTLVVLLGWSIRAAGLRAGWLVPWESRSDLVRLKSGKAMVTLVVFSVTLAILLVGIGTIAAFRAN